MVSEKSNHELKSLSASTLLLRVTPSGTVLSEHPLRVRVRATHLLQRTSQSSARHPSVIALSFTEDAILESARISDRALLNEAISPGCISGLIRGSAAGSPQCFGDDFSSGSAVWYSAARTLLARLSRA